MNRQRNFLSCMLSNLPDFPVQKTTHDRSCVLRSIRNHGYPPDPPCDIDKMLNFLGLERAIKDGVLATGVPSENLIRLI